MRTVKFAFAIATSVVLSSALAAPVGADSHKKNPSNYTCTELLELSADSVPAVVYWIDGYTSSGEEVMVTEDYFAMPVEQVVEVCKKNPSKLAAEVVKAQRQEHKK